MRSPCLSALVWTLLACSTRAEEKFALLAVGSETYSNVTVIEVSATDLFFKHAHGVGNAKLRDLSPDLQSHFHYNADKARAAEAKRLNGANQYYQTIQAQPVRPVEAAKPPEAHEVHDYPLLWRADYPTALKLAATEKKLVLLDFTGSDWCPWCIKFDQEILSTGKFAAYASQNLELVKVDFPNQTQLPAEQRKANQSLKSQFAVEGFPTYVLVDASGKELGRQTGYLESGVEGFLRELDGFRK